MNNYLFIYLHQQQIDSLLQKQLQFFPLTLKLCAVFMYIYIFLTQTFKNQSIFVLGAKRPFSEAYFLVYFEEYFTALIGRKQCKDRQPKLCVVPCDHPLALAVSFKID